MAILGSLNQRQEEKGIEQEAEGQELEPLGSSSSGYFEKFYDSLLYF